jgi:hypothetical protein
MCSDTQGEPDIILYDASNTQLQYTIDSAKLFAMMKVKPK